MKSPLVYFAREPIVGSFQIMKLRAKRILATLFWLAIITTIILNGLWEQSLWIGGAQ